MKKALFLILVLSSLVAACGASYEIDEVILLEEGTTMSNVVDLTIDSFTCSLTEAVRVRVYYISDEVYGVRKPRVITLDGSNLPCLGQSGSISSPQAYILNP